MTTDSTANAASVLDEKKIFYNRFLLIVAGLGGLLYGVDVGIIAGALPYLEATSGLNRTELSIVVAAVLLGSVFSTLFAGLLADWMGRKPLMSLSGVMFVISIPMNEIQVADTGTDFDVHGAVRWRSISSELHSWRFRCSRWLVRIFAQGFHAY